MTANSPGPYLARVISKSMRPLAAAMIAAAGAGSLLAENNASSLR